MNEFNASSPNAFPPKIVDGSAFFVAEVGDPRLRSCGDDIRRFGSIFLTGVTGVLGREIVRDLLATTDDKLFLLIRRKNRYSHWDRARKILASFGLEYLLGTRVHVFEGDVTLPDFGLSGPDREGLVREIRTVFHIAAITALNASEEDCRRNNVGGTEEALRFAREIHTAGRLDRFFYFSTAYVAGSLQTFHSPEDSLPENPVFANYYESSKYQAETLVRQAMQEGMKVTIFRPSIVVGNSETGEVSDFNVIYPFMRLFAHGMLTALPTRHENSFNIVPIDFVVRSAMAIANQKDSVGRTFHLVTENPPTIEMLLRLREQYPSVPEIEVISPEDFNVENFNFVEQNVYSMLSPYLGYLNGHLTFDTANTKKSLKGTGIEFPVTDFNFLKTLCRYAVEMGYLALK